MSSSSSCGFGNQLTVNLNTERVLSQAASHSWSRLLYPHFVLTHLFSPHRACLEVEVSR
jgi:hypothetical protein